MEWTPTFNCQPFLLFFIGFYATSIFSQCQVISKVTLEVNKQSKSNPNHVKFSLVTVKSMSCPSNWNSRKPLRSFEANLKSHDLQLFHFSHQNTNYPIGLDSVLLLTPRNQKTWRMTSCSINELLKTKTISISKL